jgi:c-di-GMP-binding flagellar brake protein YcgR
MQIQRRYARWQVKNEAKVRLEGAEASISCLVNDISFNGVQISLAQKLPKDTTLNMNIVLSNGSALNLETWVVWHKQVGNQNVYGLYFTKIKDQDKEKIYQFMRNYFPHELNKRWWKDLAENKVAGESADRRIFGRFAAKLGIRFLDLQANREGKAETVDISDKGVGFITKEDLPARTPLEMWFEMPDQGGLYYTRGEVVWSKWLEPARYRIGVNLEKADLMGLSRVLRVA